MQDVVDTSVPQAPMGEKGSSDRPGSRGETAGRVLRLLRVADGDAAHLELPPANPDMARVAIRDASSGISYNIQLSYPRYAVHAGHRVSICFLARADERRSIGVGFAKAGPPWTNLGMYTDIELTLEWTMFQQEFLVSDDEENARVHFDVGGSKASVDVSSVGLRDLTDGSLIRPGGTSAQDALGSGLGERDIAFGDVRFGSLRRVTPISHDFGYERGRPVDRYYIERFLEQHAADVAGRVLEIGDRTYTRRFGGQRVTTSDMLHLFEGEPEATLIGDLSSADHIPSNTFDCVILTQTLQLIYDFHAAIRTLHRILKPGGVLLTTFPGISQTYDTEWGGHWCWSFTEVAARRMFGDAFGSTNTVLTAHGNVLTAVCFLHGLSAEELTPAELDYDEPGYALTVAVRAVKE